jgi:hypothetical protein
MNRDGHNNVDFFVGPEVEHTPAFSKKTLFVVGEQTVDTIVKHAKANTTPHIFMGANHSFDANSISSAYWDKTITALLAGGLMVTLDYEAHLHASVLKMLNAGVWQSRNFVPLLSVRIPKIITSSHNLTVKIDDVDFKATNDGVWCMHYSEVTDSNRFTAWNEYENDSVLVDEVAPVTVEAMVAVKVAKPVAEPVKVAEPVVESKNQPDAGLDTTPTTALKADEDVQVAEQVVVAAPSTPESAADAYAEGVTVDPLGAEASKKPKGRK